MGGTSLAVPKRGPKPKKKPAPADPWAGFKPPANLDAEAKAEYARLKLVLQRVGTAATTDPRIVVAAARTHSMLEKAHQELAETFTEARLGRDAAFGNLTQIAANGTLMPHPMIAVISNQTLRLKALWNDLGLTPGSAKLGTEKQEEKKADQWAGLNLVGGA